MTTFAPISMSCGRTTSSSRTRPGARSEGRNTRTPLERLLQALQHPDNAQPALPVRHGSPPLAHAVGEVPALDAQRLLVRDPGAPHVAGTRDVLAVGAVVLVEALVVDDELLLHRHVVERGHLLRADDREAALLVRVEPRQVQVSHEPRREAQVAEDDVLDRPVHVALAERVQLARLLLGQVQQHRYVVSAQRPERVLVRAQLAKVEPVAVDVADVAELPRTCDLLQLVHARVVLEQVADHQDASCIFPRGYHALGVGDRLRKRLLDEAVLACAQHLDGKLGVQRNRRRDDNCVELVVSEQLVEVAAHTRVRELRRPALARLVRAVADPAQLGLPEPVEVARQVRPPVTEAEDTDGDRPHRRTRLAASMPRVTPRKSTTSGASRTTRSRSSSGCAVTITAQSAELRASASGSDPSPNSGSSPT